MNINENDNKEINIEELKEKMERLDKLIRRIDDFDDRDDPYGIDSYKNYSDDAVVLSKEILNDLA